MEPASELRTTEVRRDFRVKEKERAVSEIHTANQGGTAEVLRSLSGIRGLFYFIIKKEKGDKIMAKEKKLVEAITSMEEDFAQWYTDVVKKRNCADIPA